MSKSITKLTPEQEEFWASMRLRANAPKIGQPYLSSAFFQMVPVNAPGLKTMGIDKFWRVYVDFDYFMNEKGIKYAAGVFGHEPWHNLREHGVRYDNLQPMTNKQGEPVNRNAQIWNIAGDLAINGDIPNIVPDDGCIPGQGGFAKFPVGLTSEAYYEMLMQDAPSSQCKACEEKKKENKKKQQEQNGDDQDGQGDDDGNQDGKGQDGNGDQSGDQDGDQDGEGQDGNGDQDGHGDGSDMCDSCQSKQNGQGAPNCGSGAGGDALGDYEIGDPESSGVDGLTEDQVDRMKLGIAQEIRNSAPGTVPAQFRVWADEVYAGKPLDWRTLLAGAIKRAVSWKRGQLDYRRNRRHRRQYSKDIIRPALQSPKPRLGIAIDTSGSHIHKLPAVVTEIEGIVKQVGIRGNELLAFGVDVEVTEVTAVKDPSTVLENMVGGGGTDMRVGLEQLGELGRKNRIDIGVMLTDLETGWPEKPPYTGIRYIVCGIVTKDEWSQRYAQAAKDAIGSWADVILIDFDEA